MRNSLESKVCLCDPGFNANLSKCHSNKLKESPKQWAAIFDWMFFLLVLSREWMGMGEWGNGMIITSDYGSFPHSLLSSSKFFWRFLRSSLSIHRFAFCRWHAGKHGHSLWWMFQFMKWKWNFRKKFHHWKTHLRAIPRKYLWKCVKYCKIIHGKNAGIPETPVPTNGNMQQVNYIGIDTCLQHVICVYNIFKQTGGNIKHHHPEVLLFLNAFPGRTIIYSWRCLRSI